MLKSEEREKTTAKTTEIQEDEDDEENQLNATHRTHRELREAENSIHRAVIDAARRTDRLERIERKSARLRGSADRFVLRILSSSETEKEEKWNGTKRRKRQKTTDER